MNVKVVEAQKVFKEDFFGMIVTFDKELRIYMILESFEVSQSFNISD